ncbi:hypothetical protein WA026_004728, partial [Henosepilachna vigintioctopunctata]
ELDQMIYYGQEKLCRVKRRYESIQDVKETQHSLRNLYNAVNEVATSKWRRHPS